MKLRILAASIAIIGVSGSAVAQSAAPSTARVEITGSSIKRIASEGALPIDVITRAQLDKSGFATAEQFVASMSIAGNGTDNLASLGGNASQVDPNKSPDGINNYGNSSANLRGLGAQNTLILLNGRRLSNHGLKGATVDLGAIPLGAIERIEILRDGASAIYGTDAIGGVMNFILRRDYSGLEVSSGLDVTEGGGGNTYKASATWGFGSLELDRFNVMMAVSASKNEILNAQDRDFASNGHMPSIGVAQETIGTPYATQTRLAPSGGRSSALVRSADARFSNVNLLQLQGKCDTIDNMYPYAANVTGVTSRTYGCSYNYAGGAVLQQPFETQSVVSRANFQIAPNHLAFVEFFGSQTNSTKHFEPNQITSSLSANRFIYPVGGKYYQDLGTLYPNMKAETGMSFDNTKPITFRWRCMECGPRVIDTETYNQRLLVGAEGVVGNFDYKFGALTGRATAKSKLVDGYNYTDKLNSAIASGNVNLWLAPGQAQDVAGMSLIDASAARNINHLSGETTIKEFDGTISGPIFKLPAGDLAVAVGFDRRSESYQLSINPITPTIWQAPSDSDFGKRTRDVTAYFAEVLIPITKELEATFAVRTDDYSDFGKTTNPKVALRYQPTNNLVFRASANTGFRAPTFNQLYGGGVPDPNNLPILPSVRNDPTAVCDGTGALTGSAREGYCGVNFQYATGANPFLKPEESKQWSIGFVAEPMEWLTVGADAWHVERTQIIDFLGALDVLNHYDQLNTFVFRDATGKIDYIASGRINAAGAITSGVDMNATVRGKLGSGRWSATLAGSYLSSYKSRLFETDPWVDTVGKYSEDSLRLRWKHNLSVTYAQGPWSGTLAQSYIDGHEAYVWEDTNVTQPGGKVDSYIRYNVSASYTGLKNATINIGINNLLNTNPPISIHHPDYVGGTSWDPRVGDPRGRSYFANITYKFL